MKSTVYTNTLSHPSMTQHENPAHDLDALIPQTRHTLEVKKSFWENILSSPLKSKFSLLQLPIDSTLLTACRHWVFSVVLAVCENVLEVGEEVFGGAQSSDWGQGLESFSMNLVAPRARRLHVRCTYSPPLFPVITDMELIIWFLIVLGPCSPNS